MAKIPMTVDIQNGAAIERAILIAYANRLNLAFGRAVRGGMKARLGDVVESAIKASPEYSSLLSDRLWHELGVLNSNVALQDIINTIKDSIECRAITVKPVGQTLRGGLEVRILRADFSDVIGLPASSFISEHGFQIDWLRWLLFQGDSLINFEYRFESGYENRSRTGDGIMLRGGTWKVPSEYSGTIDDNWLTRALIGIDSDVLKIVIQEVKKSF